MKTSLFLVAAIFLGLYGYAHLTRPDPKFAPADPQTSRIYRKVVKETNEREQLEAETVATTQANR